MVCSDFYNIPLLHARTTSSWRFLSFCGKSLKPLECCSESVLMFNDMKVMFLQSVDNEEKCRPNRLYHLFVSVLLEAPRRN